MKALFSRLLRGRRRGRNSMQQTSQKVRPYLRPCLEALEDRVVPTLCVWTGGSILSNDWSDSFNWKDRVRPTGFLDDVTMPADAKQRTNDVDIGVLGTVQLGQLRIEGGDYHLRGKDLQCFRGVLVDAGNNTIDNKLDFGFAREGHIDVEGGSLTLTGRVVGDPEISGGENLFKLGAGTLKVSNLFGDQSGLGTVNKSAFRAFVVADGLVSMEPGGQLLVDLVVGGTVRLQSGGDQISFFGSEFGFLPNVNVDPGGVIDLHGYSEGLGHLQLNGGQITSTGTGAGHLIIEADVTTTLSDQGAIIDVDNVDLGTTDRTFIVNNGTAVNDLLISSRIQGTGGLIKRGGGLMRLSGTLSNTYTGQTRVNEGTLGLDKPDNIKALSGGLVIGDGAGGTNADGVLLFSDEQIPNDIVVRVNSSGSFSFSTHTQTLGGLILAGGNVATGFGLLKLQGDVTTESSSALPTISGRLSLQNATSTPRVFNIKDLTALIVDAAIVDGALIKTGPGPMKMSGSSPNTYTGSTTVNEGALILGKSSGPAISGSLVVGDGRGGADADQVALALQSPNQIASGVAVTVNSSGLLDLNSNNATIGNLTLNGGHVATENGLLTLSGNVTATSAPTVATISGRLDIGIDLNRGIIRRSFDVANSVSGTDLLIDAVIQGGGLIKNGAGTLELTANNPYGFTTVLNDGILLVNGTLSNSAVHIFGGTLRGDGSVKGITAAGGKIQPGEGVGTLTSTGDVTLQAGASFQPQVIPLAPDPHDLLRAQGTVNLGAAGLSVQPLFLTSVPPPIPVLIDDSSASFTSTGFSASGTTAGVVGNTFRFATAGNGAAQATWTFQGLQPGSYRVSAAWGLGSTNRVSNAPYTILDGATPVTTVRVNQKLTAADFSAFGVGWDILGVVQVTSNSLTVQLTNDADSGLVIADAILIEPRQVVIIDNDGTDPVVGTFGNLPEGATVSAVATGVVNGQIVQQTQLYTISYRANDGNDVGLAYITTATAAQDLLIAPNVIHEGQQVTLTGHLTDPDVGDFLTLTIDWGDGKTETQHPGTEPFAFAHRYAGNPPGPPPGTYTVHLTWFDQHNAGNSRDLTVAVQNGAPTAPRGADVQPLAGDRGGPIETHHAGTRPLALDHRSAGSGRDPVVAAQYGAPSVFRTAEDVLPTGATLAPGGFFADLGLQDHGTAVDVRQLPGDRLHGDRLHFRVAHDLNHSSDDLVVAELVPSHPRALGIRDLQETEVEGVVPALLFDM